MTGYGALAKATDLDRLFVLLNTDTYALAFGPHLSYSSCSSRPLEVSEFPEQWTRSVLFNRSPGPRKISDLRPARLRQFG